MRSAAAAPVVVLALLASAAALAPSKRALLQEGLEDDGHDDGTPFSEIAIPPAAGMPPADNSAEAEIGGPAAGMPPADNGTDAEIDLPPAGNGTDAEIDLPPAGNGTDAEIDLPPAAGMPPADNGTDAEIDLPPAAGMPPADNGTDAVIGTPAADNGTQADNGTAVPPVDGMPPEEDGTPPEDGAPPSEDSSGFPTLDVFHCGSIPESFPSNNHTPSVLFLGDTISCGAFNASMKHGVWDRAGINAQHVGGCRYADSAVDWGATDWETGKLLIDWTQGNTEYALHCTDPTNPDNWLSFLGIFDVIHFNFGLQDVSKPHAFIEHIGPSQHVELERYGQNVRTIYDRLQKHAQKVVWATTTPVPTDTGDCELCRDAQDVAIYNSKAKEALPDDVIVDDLYAVVNNHCHDGFEECSDWLEEDATFTDGGELNVLDVVKGSVIATLQQLYPAVDFTCRDYKPIDKCMHYLENGKCDGSDKAMKKCAVTCGMCNTTSLGPQFRFI
jgi:hypothetical protein